MAQTVNPQTLDDLLRFIANPPPGDRSLTASGDQVNVSPEFVNQVQFNLTPGTKNKFPVPAGLPLVSGDTLGNLRGGQNFLMNTDNPPNLHLELPDFFFMQNALRLGIRNLTMAEINDPADITMSRCGPNEGYPYCGGNGTATFTRGSADVPVTHTIADAISAFKANRLVVASLAGALRPNSLISSITTVDANNIVLHLDRPVLTSGTGALFSIGTTADFTGLDFGSIVAEINMEPFICPFLGDAYTPGAKRDKFATSFHTITEERARDLTGTGPFVDMAKGCSWRIQTTRIGHTNLFDTAKFHADGSFMIGEGAMAAGSTGDQVQIRGFGGQDEQQIVTLNGPPTGGTFALQFYEDPLALAPSGYANGAGTGPIPYNAPLDNNDGGAGQNDVRWFIADTIRRALQGTPPSPTTAQAYQALLITSTGTHANDAPFTIDFGGNAVANAVTGFLENRNFIRMGQSSSLTAPAGITPSVTVSAVQDGLPSDADHRLLYLRRATSGTGDYVTVLDPSGNPVWRISAGKSFGAVGITTPLPTNATDGFAYIPKMAGAPTGTPAVGGGAPMVYDTTNNKLWVWNSATLAWKGAVFA